MATVNELGAQELCVLEFWHRMGAVGDGQCTGTSTSFSVPCTGFTHLAIAVVMAAPHAVFN